MVIIVISLTFPVLSSAQGSDDHTAREEAEGKALWEKLQAEELKCEDLTDENFGALGEYFMGQMAGDSHEAMNKMMVQMMGEEGEEQMHIVMGKRISGCDPNVSIPGMGGGMMGMMMPMMGYPNFVQRGGEGAMMGPGWMWLGGIIWLVTWVLVILVLVALLRWLWKKGGEKK